MARRWWRVAELEPGEVLSCNFCGEEITTSPFLLEGESGWALCRFDELPRFEERLDDRLRDLQSGAVVE